VTKAPFKIQAACSLIIAPTGEERILCVSRKDDPHAWGLPGGKVERGETPKAGAKRELREETGLVMHPGHASRLFLGQCAVPNTGRYMLTATYLVPTWTGEINTSEEGRVGWRTWKDLFRGPFAEYNVALHDAYRKLALARTFR
jgi:ADP-ribose pyrophosphatase YjhB (NUDIX family)